jgi:heptosyltransferase-1
MLRILFIKLTSLGDLIHALPALTDAYRAVPDLKVDWLIDESFSEVATWHPAVDQIFTTNHRKWRSSLFSSIGPIADTIKKLRKNEYDLVIDGQGNFKTALISLFMKGPTAGFDRKSVREPIASLAYSKKYPASWSIHAIDRLRLLLSSALNYPLPKTAPDFSIKPFGTIDAANYLVFIPNAGWKTKLWPEDHCRKLIEMVTGAGHQILIPWGNQQEKMRAERLATNPLVKVLPKMTLSQIGKVIAQAKACVSMDTGLSHLAAALSIPTVTLYGATDSGIIGASGKNQLHLQSTLACAPCSKKQCKFPSHSLNPPCMAELTPDRVFNQLMKIL